MNRPPRAPRPAVNGFKSQQVFPVWVTRMHEPGSPEGFAQIAALTADQARFIFEQLVARDFPAVKLSSWTTPEIISRLYFMGRAGPVFVAMPKDTPRIVRGDGG